MSRLAAAGGAGEAVLAYGRGRSYGDACLNGGGTILDTAGLDRFLAFDAAAGVLRAEAGVTLAEVLALVVPHGWFLPVTPGTKSSRSAGPSPTTSTARTTTPRARFGRFVTRLGLVRSTGEALELVPGDPLFAATVAGLGLTGLITFVELRLLRIPSDRIDQTTARFRSLADFFGLSEAAERAEPLCRGVAGHAPRRGPGRAHGRRPRPGRGRGRAARARRPLTRRAWPSLRTPRRGRCAR